MLQKVLSISKSIFWELLLAFLLVALIPALMTGSVSLWLSYQIGKQRTLAQLDSLVTLKSAEIETWTKELSLGLEMLEGEDDLTELALPLLQGELSPADSEQSHDKLLTSLKSIVINNHLFENVCLLDDKGRAVVCTDPGKEGLDLSTTSYYQQGLQKEFISQPFHETPSNQRFLVVVARPVIMPDSGAVGVLAGFSDISILEKIMEEPLNLGVTGESYLVGADYIPVTSLRFPTSSSIPQVNSDGIKFAIENKISGHGIYRDYHDNPAIGAYTWLPSLQMALVVEQGEVEAFTPTYEMLKISLYVALIAVFLTVIIVFFITRSIATPLTVLSTTAVKIMEGNLDHVADVKRQDEIGQLAQVFNRMTSQLRNLIQELQIELAERKRAENALRESELRLRTILRTAMDGFWRVDLQGNILEVNEAYCQMSGYSEQELLTKNISDLESIEQQTETIAHIQKILEKGAERFETLHIRRDGSKYAAEISVQRTQEQGDTLFGFIRDITERKQAEDALRKSEMRYRLLVEHAPAITYVVSLPSEETTYVSPQIEQILGFTPEEWVTDPDIWQRQIHPEDLERVLAEAKASMASDGDFVSEYRIFTRDSRIVWLHDQSHHIDEPGHKKIVQGIEFDITNLKQAEEKIQRQLNYLATLSAIDRVITSSFDLNNNLNSILMYIIPQLGVDAASIKLLDPDKLMLNHSAGKGFRSDLAKRTQVWLRKSYSGKAILKQEIVQIADPNEHADDPFLVTLFQKEGFTDYYGVPLLVKGKSVGVLEVFHRTPFHPNQEWLNFLNMLAGQTAIAIDNAQLFDGMQKSNFNLLMAYDATIEGWSRAMDLRDKETEGHTLRVTELTLELARIMNIDENELIHIRRGSLLHDIGKLGVPDKILFKPGKLTKKEWDVMKQHPVYAYEMLWPIQYLRPALDIPYCHHEKWDGTGYPRGLKEEEIPLPARIFAIIDVWDALTSHRPYRPAWTREQTITHIRSLAGTHFEPRVVDYFMDFIARRNDL